MRKENALTAISNLYQKHLEVPTSDFEFLDCFVALIVDFDFDRDWFAMQVELWSKPQKKRHFIAGVVAE